MIASPTRKAAFERAGKYLRTPEPPGHSELMYRKNLDILCLRWLQPAMTLRLDPSVWRNREQIRNKVYIYPNPIARPSWTLALSTQRSWHPPAADNEERAALAHRPTARRREIDSCRLANGQLFRPRFDLCMAN